MLIVFFCNFCPAVIFLSLPLSEHVASFVLHDGAAGKHHAGLQEFNPRNVQRSYIPCEVFDYIKLEALLRRPRWIHRSLPFGLLAVPDKASVALEREQRREHLLTGISCTWNGQECCAWQERCIACAGFACPAGSPAGLLAHSWVLCPALWPTPVLDVGKLVWISLLPLPPETEQLGTACSSRTPASSSNMAAGFVRTAAAAAAVTSAPESIEPPDMRNHVCFSDACAFLCVCRVTWAQLELRVQRGPVEFPAEDCAQHTSQIACLICTSVLFESINVAILSSPVVVSHYMYQCRASHTKLLATSLPVNNGSSLPLPPHMRSIHHCHNFCLRSSLPFHHDHVAVRFCAFLM